MLLSQLQKFRDELRNRSRVLKKLGHIDADGVVQLKGRAACLIDTGDELLVTELMFNGELSPLSLSLHSLLLIFLGVHILYLIKVKIQALVLDIIYKTIISNKKNPGFSSAQFLGFGYLYNMPKV